MISQTRPSASRQFQVRATRVARPADLKAAGAFAYCVEVSPANGDKRRHARRRTRLRAGKILDVVNGFLADCRIHDRSSAGARLRVQSGLALTRCLRLYDDERDVLLDADIVWRRGLDVGIRFVGDARGPKLSAMHRNLLRGKFYAMRA